MSRLRHSTIRLWLSLTAVLLSAVVSAPVGASSCVELGADQKVAAKASCEMAACCCEASVQSTQASGSQLQNAGCDCALQQAPATSTPFVAEARSFVAAFGLPVTADLASFEVIRGPCLASDENHRPRAGATLPKPSRAPPAGRR